MKFIINKEEFVKSLNNVCRIVQPSGLYPILSELKLVLNNNGLSLTGSNGDVSITETIPLFKGDKEIIRDVKQGSVLVNSKLLYDVSKKFNGNEIPFELLDESVACVSKENSSFKLPTIRVEEYDEIDFSKTGTSLKVNKQEFLDAINTVVFATSQKDNTSRHILTCVNLAAENNKLILTATDGARLASKTISCEINTKINVNIPNKTLLDAIRSAQNEEYITLYVTEKKVLFEFANCLIVTRIIADEYPNTRNIIPTSFFYHLEVNSDEFLNALDRVSLLSYGKNNVVKLTMSESKVELSCNSQQYGSANEVLNNIKYKYQGERLEINFRFNYVAEAIRALKSEDIMISFIGEMKPFTVSNKDDNSIIQLITPVRA